MVKIEMNGNENSYGRPLAHVVNPNHLGLRLQQFFDSNWILGCKRASNLVVTF